MTTTYGDRAIVVRIIEGMLGDCDSPADRHRRAATLMAALDGILIEALLRPEAERQGFTSAVGLTMAGLAEPSR